jgi:ATP-binding cassette subfamily G (WHITE) protein 2 (PDR)
LLNVCSPQREAVQFAAILRQPRHVPKEEKLAYAEEILVLLGMDHYADAVVGVTGEGLNVEERKRLSIGEFSPPSLTEFTDETLTILFNASGRDGGQA